MHRVSSAPLRRPRKPRTLRIELERLLHIARGRCRDVGVASKCAIEGIYASLRMAGSAKPAVRRDREALPPRARSRRGLGAEARRKARRESSAPRDDPPLDAALRGRAAEPRLAPQRLRGRLSSRQTSKPRAAPLVWLALRSSGAHDREPISGRRVCDATARHLERSCNRWSFKSDTEAEGRTFRPSCRAGLPLVWAGTQDGLLAVVWGCRCSAGPSARSRRA